MKLQNRTHVTGLLLVLFTAFSVSACRKKRADAPPSPDLTTAEWKLADGNHKDLWMRKLSRKLRGGIEPTEAQMVAWRGLPPRQIFNEILKTPEFENGALDFILHVLGFKNDDLIFPDGKLNTMSSYFDPTINRSVVSISPAISGALAILSGEDFLSKISSLSGPLYVATLPDDLVDFGDQKHDFQKEIHELYARTVRAAEMLHEMQKTQKLDFSICKIVNAEGDGNLFVRFLDPLVFNYIFFPTISISFFIGCNTPLATKPDPTDEELKLPEGFDTVLAQADNGNLIMGRYLEEFGSEKYKPKTIHDLKTFAFTSPDESVFSPLSSSQQIADNWVWGRLVNSSTNRNRKRAAYVLKRFFCDDLTPIGVETPSTHTLDVHGSDPGCASCHYKLDPMAGFFRKLGRGGLSFEGKEMVRFDDNAVDVSETYFSSWNQIGYIRSRTDDSLNTYGINRKDPSFSDLVNIIKSAPEVRHCMTKRAFQFMAGEDVALDQGYLRELSKSFDPETTANSTEALKNVLWSVSVSYSFAADTSKQGQCYDFPRGYIAAGKPPCEVNFIVEQNCVSCHSSAAAAGGLDMTAWEGPTKLSAPGGFKHLDSDGKPLHFVESITRIKDRLNHSDPMKRMPLLKVMSPVDRETLYLWFDSKEKEYAP